MIELLFITVVLISLFSISISFWVGWHCGRASILSRKRKPYTSADLDREFMESIEQEGEE